MTYEYEKVVVIPFLIAIFTIIMETLPKEIKNNPVSLDMAIIVCFTSFLIPFSIELRNSIINLEFIKDYINVCKKIKRVQTESQNDP